MFQVTLPEEFRASTKNISEDVILNYLDNMSSFVFDGDAFEGIDEVLPPTFGMGENQAVTLGRN